LALLACSACAPVMREARLVSGSPPSEREQEARERVSEGKCDGRYALFFPGLGQLCRGRTVEASLMASLGMAELSTALVSGAKNGFGQPAAGVPLLAFGDLLTYSVMDTVLESQRAARLQFVPQETPAELARAPFSAEVLARPSVWAGIAGTLAAGLLISRIVDGPLNTQNFAKRPVLFGREMNSAIGYPLAAGIGVGLFEHVALAEESAFRGVLQSGWARSWGEERGWIYGSLAFGLLHTTNIFFMPSSDRVGYLAVGVPFITLLGSYLGLAYRWSGYSLAPPVAIHFWYDFLIEAASFVSDPKNSPLAVSWGVPF
jgi:membrane protease YdiL (CAAX protease family)